MFDKFTQFLDEKLSTPMAKLAEQRHLRAVRDGIIATLPLIIVSSMFLVVAFSHNAMPETWALKEIIASNAGKILLPYRMAMFIMTLYAVFGIGYSLARSYKLDGLTGGILAELAFMLTIIPKSVGAVPPGLLELAAGTEFAGYLGTVATGWLMPMGNLGSGGMFIGILVAFFSVEVYRFTQKSGFKVSMPDSVPASVARSFEALTPTLIVLLSVSIVTMWLQIDVHGFINNLMKPLITATDTLPSVLLLNFLNSFFWSFGIHGSSVVGSIVRPLWTILLDANGVAFAAGEMIPHIAAEPFFQWFIYIGGSGMTIGLAILFAFNSKSAYGKALGKTAIIPSIFNINEPMIFGAPIVLNPILIIPFILAPTAGAIVAWFATSAGLVNRVTVLAPWTLPGPIGAFLATGGDWRAMVLNILLIVMSVIIYYPFFRMYDHKLLAEEHEGAAE